MSRLQQIFQKKKKCYIGYLTAGDGGVNQTALYAKALIQNGVDILEIGIPFSDPIADSPIVQLSHKRALERKTGISTLLTIAQSIRKEFADIPLIVCSYYNPLLQKGKTFLRELKESGFDGISVVDLPPPERTDHDPFFQDLVSVGLDPILSVAASTRDERLLAIQRLAKGYLYFLPQALHLKDAAKYLQTLYNRFKLPIVYGEEVSSNKEAAAILQHVDGFIVKSLFAGQQTNSGSLEELSSLAKSLDPVTIHDGVKICSSLKT
jgi:tryptophan synthase, alpha subunit